MGGRDYLLQVVNSLPYKQWAMNHPIDAGKVAAELAGTRKPSASSNYAKGLIGLARLYPLPSPPLVTVQWEGITGVVAQAASWPADYPTAVAARSAGMKRLMLQFGDVTTNDANRREVAGGWAQKWRDALGGSSPVMKWWRVNQSEGNTAPYPEILWPAIANTEDLAEMARIPALLDAGAQGLFLLGKPHGPLPIARLNKDGIVVFAECFRMAVTSDHTIKNSHDWFKAAGLDMRLWRPALQAFGVQFAPLGEQAAEAKAMGARGIAVYLSENVSAQEWAAIKAGYGG